MESEDSRWKRLPAGALPIAYATKLSASVALLVKTTSSTSAPMNFATIARAFSIAVVASSAN